MLDAAKITFLVYGILLIVGGLMGASRSPVSLIAGGVGGVLALLASYLLSRGQGAGLWLGLATAVLIGGAMLQRGLRLMRETGQFPLFPPGALLALSVVVLIVTVAALARAGRG